VAGFQAVSNKAVIVGFERNVRVLDQLFIGFKFLEDVLLGAFRDFGLAFTVVLDGEVLRVLSIEFEKGKEPNLSDA